MGYAGGEIRRGLSTTVHSVLNSCANWPPFAIFVRCNVPVLLHVLLRAAMNFVFLAVYF